MTTQHNGRPKHKTVGHVFVIGKSENIKSKTDDIDLTRIGNSLENFATVTDSVSDSIDAVVSPMSIQTQLTGKGLLDQIDRHSHHCNLLDELTELLTPSLEIEEILEQVTTRSSKALGNNTFAVIWTDSINNNLDDVGHEHLIQTLNKRILHNPERLAIKTVADVLIKGKPLVVTDFQLSKVNVECQHRDQTKNTATLLVVPVKIQRRTVGALALIGLQPSSLDTDHLKLAIRLARLTAVAIKNAHLFKELQLKSITDPLTGLYNTRLFHELLNREIARADRFISPLSLLLIDIDSFKQVNETHGHIVGDKVLKWVARTLEECVRNTDYIFRTGGDEFGLLLSETPSQGAILVAEKIRAKIQHSDLTKVAGYVGSITVSIGVSQYEMRTDLENLVATADSALLKAKHFSKNCIRTIDDQTAKEESTPQTEKVLQADKNN